MAPPGLETLGASSANVSVPKRKPAAAKPEDTREILDVTKPYDISYCCFDESFFNTGTRTLSLGNHFSSGDRDAEGIITRMILHPGGFVELVLESKLVVGKVTTAILFKPKTATPLVGKYRSEYFPEKQQDG